MSKTPHRTSRTTPKHRATTSRKRSSTKSTIGARKHAATPRLRGIHHVHFGLTALLVISTLVSMVMSLGATTSQTSANATCTVTVSATLVNSCRPWLGAAVGGYPGASGFAAEIANHEGRIGRKLDIVHDYRTPGQVLTMDEQTLAKRANTILLLNWKPALKWSDAAGGNSTVNAQIDAMANSIKSLGSAKIMLAVFHEPENDVSPGGDPNCKITYKGNAGTVADYTNMWHNVRARFNAKGVTNVVWVMNYMGFSGWDCIVNDLWPGNNYVDWIMWDPYAYSSSSFSNMVSRFYNVLKTKNDNGAHYYTSKPWGIAEWASGNGSTQAQAYALYDGADSAKTVVDSGSYPYLKAYVVWDNNANSDPNQIQYDRVGNLDPTEQSHYNNFARDPRLTDAYYQSSPPPPPPPPPAADTTPPSVTLTSPANNTTTSGMVSVTGTASDNVGVTSVSMLVDNIYYATNTAAPYTFSLDASQLQPGAHTIMLRAWDAANNIGNSGSVTINVPTPSNQNEGGGTTTPSPTQGDGSPQTVIEFGGSPTSNTIPVDGNLTFVPSDNGSDLTIDVDGKQNTGDTVNTKRLTNGTHVITIRQGDKTITQKIVVSNPWKVAALNMLRAHPVTYTIGGLAAFALLYVMVWFARKYIPEAIDTYKTLRGLNKRIDPDLMPHHWN